MQRPETSVVLNLQHWQKLCPRICIWWPKSFTVWQFQRVKTEITQWALRERDLIFSAGAYACSYAHACTVPSTCCSYYSCGNVNESEREAVLSGDLLQSLWYIVAVWISLMPVRAELWNFRKTRTPHNMLSTYSGLGATANPNLLTVPKRAWQTNAIS